MSTIRQVKINKSSFHKSRKVVFTDDKICQHLLRHPDFFVRHARRLEGLRISHPVRGVISLPEWQMGRQRAKIKQLEQEIQSLITHATQNEILFERLMALQLALFNTTDLDEMLAKLNEWARSLGLQGAYLYLFEHKWQISAPSKYQHLSISVDKFDFIRIRHLQYNYHYLGQLCQSEMAWLLPQLECHGSVAMSLLGQFGDLGLLIFVSRDPHYYQYGQGTLLLEKISLILPVLVGRWIAKK